MNISIRRNSIQSQQNFRGIYYTKLPTYDKLRNNSTREKFIFIEQTSKDSAYRFVQSSVLLK